MDKNSKTVIITGGNSGLGYQCAKNIASYDKNYHIIIACRNQEKSKKAIEKLIADTGNRNIHAIELDLASLFSVRSFYKTFSESDLPPLYAVVCNAGIGANKKITYTKDGFEKTFGVNHLGHFLLANLLLKKVSTTGRIVFVSSDTHDPPSFFPFYPLIYTDAMLLAYPERYSDGINQKSNSMLRYATSKLCNIYCTYEMVEKIMSETNTKITVNAFNPGFMPETGLNGTQNSMMRLITKFMALILGRLGSLKNSGVFLATLITSPHFDSLTGKYVDRGKIIKSSTLSYDKANAENLWDRSVELVNLKADETIFKMSK